MEALRYLSFLDKDGWIITSSNPFVNIPNYPDPNELLAELAALPHVQLAHIDDIAKDNNLPRGANMVLLGMAAPYVEIVSIEQLRSAITTVFARKGEKVVNDNLTAFDLGVSAVK